MEGIIITSAVMVIVHLFGVFLGYQIRYRRRAWLISGYSRHRVHDEDGLTSFIGGGVLAIGCFGVVTGLLLLVFPAYVHVLMRFNVAVTVAIVCRLVVGARRFHD